MTSYNIIFLLIILGVCLKNDALCGDLCAYSHNVHESANGRVSTAEHEPSAATTGP